MIPEGYEKLAVIGIAWKGNYAADTAYKLMNAVYYEGSTFVALKDDPVTPPVADDTNWTYLAKGFGELLLSAVTALDTSGVVGDVGGQVQAQTLMDAIADKVMTKLLAKSQIVNNLLATDPGTVLAAPMGKTLSDKYVDLLNKYNQLNRELAYSVVAVDKNANVIRDSYSSGYKKSGFGILTIDIYTKPTVTAYTEYEILYTGFRPKNVTIVSACASMDKSVSISCGIDGMIKMNTGTASGSFNVRVQMVLDLK